MPPRTRTNKTTKSLKENINFGDKTKVKVTGKISKPTRKALADKTNSASDDNLSIEVLKECPKKAQANAKKVEIEGVLNVITDRPRRDRRLPSRFNENQVLLNLSQNNESANKTPSKVDNVFTPAKCDTESPFKTPQKSAERSIVASRPRRVCRLPSRLEDHSISPNKFIPVLPVQASTPIQKKPKIVQPTHSNDKDVTSVNKQLTSSTKISTNCSEKHKKVNKERKSIATKVAVSNNNAGHGRTVRNRKLPPTKDITKTNITSKSPKKSPNSPVKKTNKKPISNDFSFRILEDKKQKDIKDNNLDVYEFTYDPTEEPPPQKKKTKKVTRKKPANPKTKQILYRNNYDKNVAKALAVLKNVVAKKPTQPTQPKPVENTQKTIPPAPPKVVDAPITKVTEITVSDKTQQNVTTPSLVTVQNSIRIEDIAADFEPSLCHHELNYSPTNSPHPNKTPSHSSDTNQIGGRVALNYQDPLNLKENLSFFDDPPAASSSMNVSNRHPHASPWRVEFQDLPIKWHVNSYVKPNMTPAVECSFVNFNDSKNKHVYTNMVSEANDLLPEIVENDKPNLIQTSIISFIREVAEKSVNKKRGRSATPKRAAKENETLNTVELKKTPRQVVTPRKTGDRNVDTPNEKTTTNLNKESTTPTEKSRESLKRKLDEDLNAVAAKTPRQSNEKDNTFFGFDESENSENMENISPKKKDTKARSLRPRTRGVLKQINEQVRPMRASIPVAAKTANSEVINKMFEEMKSATDAPVFPEKDYLPDKEITNINEELENELSDEDSNSVHLFEDIEVVHHLKPQRKSYGKAKKVAFHHNLQSGSDSQSAMLPREAESGSEDDLADLTFEIPNVKEKKAKKKTKKTKMTKKEAEEAEAWAAGFNSMCEDIDEFPLVVE